MLSGYAHTRVTSGGQQRGNMLLVTALLLSVAAVILSVVQYATSVTNLKQTNSDQQGIFLATQAALTAMNDATNWLLAQSNRPVTCTSSGCTTVYASTALAGGAAAQSSTWWNTGTDSRAYSGSFPNVATQPRYVIEELACNASNNIFVYKITAMGTGASSDSKVFLSRTLNTRLQAASTPVTFWNDLTNALNYSGHNTSRTLTIGTSGQIQLINFQVDMRTGVSTGCPYNFIVTFSRNGGASTQYQGIPSNLTDYLGNICYNYSPYSGGVTISPAYPVQSGDSLHITLDTSSYPNQFSTGTLDGTAGNLLVFISGINTPSFCP